MIRRGVIVIITCIIACSGGVAHAGWNMVFDDEFKAPQLNQDNWFTRYIYGNETLDKLNDEKEVYRDHNNHVLTSGYLQLTAYAMPDGTYESGMIRSKRTFYYGYYEARIRLPQGKGVFPAFWLNPDYTADGKVGWPPEIDVFEFVNNVLNDNAHMVHIATDGDSADNHLIYSHPDFNKQWHDYVAKRDLTETWHVWGLLWLPDKVAMYLDGVKLYEQAYKWVTKSGELGAPAHILLNFAIGGQWAGRFGIDNWSFPQSLDVAYVRVYQYTPNEPSTTKSLRYLPDIAKITYDAPGDLARSTVYPAKAPAQVKAGDEINITYRMDTLPTAQPVMLRLSLMTLFGERAGETVISLPSDTTDKAHKLEETIKFNIPTKLKPGRYDVQAALASCPHIPCSAGSFVNIPLTPANGAAREAGNWFRIATIEVERTVTDHD